MSRTRMFPVPILILVLAGLTPRAVAESLDPPNVFEPPEHEPGASLRITVDNDLRELFVNGELVQVDPETASNWTLTSVVPLSLQPGRNVIAIKATDGGVIAGLLAELTVDHSTLVSNEAWKVHHDAPEGWSDPAFDDSTWKAATPYGDHPGGVWGTRVMGMDGSGATWIWNEVNTLNGEIEPTVYFRFTFHVRAGWVASP